MTGDPDDLGPLPFGLTPETLAGVRILYGFYSQRTNAGRQELAISGDGTVTLLHTPLAQSEPETREGRLALPLVARLLEVLAEEEFRALDDHYRATDQPAGARRIITLILSETEEKEVIVDEPRSPEFERVAGALKMAAAVALPEAVGQRFFPNL